MGPPPHTWQHAHVVKKGYLHCALTGKSSDKFKYFIDFAPSKMGFLGFLPIAVIMTASFILAEGQGMNSWGFLHNPTFSLLTAFQHHFLI